MTLLEVRKILNQIEMTRRLPRFQLFFKDVKEDDDFGKTSHNTIMLQRKQQILGEKQDEVINKLRGKLIDNYNVEDFPELQGILQIQKIEENAYNDEQVLNFMTHAKAFDEMIKITWEYTDGEKTRKLLSIMDIGRKLMAILLQNYDTNSSLLTITQEDYDAIAEHEKSLFKKACE